MSSSSQAYTRERFGMIPRAARPQGQLNFMPDSAMSDFRLTLASHSPPSYIRTTASSSPASSSFSPADSSPAFGARAAPIEQTGPRSLEIYDPALFVIGPHVTSGASEPAQLDIEEPAVIDFLKSDPSHIVEVVLRAARNRPVSDMDSAWGLHENLTEFPFMPCQITHWDINTALGVHHALVQRDKTIPIYTERAPLLTSINAVYQTVRDLTEAGLHGIPVSSIYVGAQVVNRVNLFTNRWALHGHQAASWQPGAPWRSPRFVINARAECDQTVSRMRNVCRALMSPTSVEEVARGTNMVIKTLLVRPHRGLYIVGHELDLATLIRCLDIVPVDNSTETREAAAFARSFGSSMYTKLCELRQYRAVIEKYAQLVPAHTIKDARAMVASGHLTWEELSILQEHDLLLAVTGTAHDGPGGTVPACAHIVRHISGRDFDSDRIQQLLEQPDAESSSRRKPSVRELPARNMPVSTARNTPVIASRRISDRLDALLERVHIGGQ